MTMVAVRVIGQRHFPVVGASSVALDMLHWVMHIVPYCCIVMAIKMANNVPAFLSSLIWLSPTTVGKDHVIVHIILN